LTEQVTNERLTAELSRHLSPDRLDALMAEGAGWTEQQAMEAADSDEQTLSPPAEFLASTGR
jgi:hypothetical protein